MFIMEWRLVNNICTCSLISLKHVSLQCLVFDPHPKHIPIEYRIPIKKRKQITPKYLTFLFLFETEGQQNQRHKWNNQEEKKSCTLTKGRQSPSGSRHRHVKEDNNRHPSKTTPTPLAKNNPKTTMPSLNTNPSRLPSVSSPVPLNIYLAPPTQNVS